MVNRSSRIMLFIVIILTLSSFALAGVEANDVNSYKVRPGDSLYKISQRHGVSIWSIKLANNLKGDQIKADDTLLIPSRGRVSSQVSLIWPVKGRISSNYGYRIHPITGERSLHSGTDIAVPTGTKIRAASAGTVVWSGWVNGYGKTVIIDHGNGLRTLYAHNSHLVVKSGAWVNTSQVIALAGSTGRSTGPHLHFEVQINGKAVNPLSYLP